MAFSFPCHGLSGEWLRMVRSLLSPRSSGWGQRQEEAWGASSAWGPRREVWANPGEEEASGEGLRRRDLGRRGAGRIEGRAKAKVPREEGTQWVGLCGKRDQVQQGQAVGSLLRGLCVEAWVGSIRWSGRRAELGESSGAVLRRRVDEAGGEGSRETIEPEWGGPVLQADGPSSGPFKRRKSPS